MRLRVKRVIAIAAWLLLAGSAAGETGCQLSTVAELPVTMAGPKPMIHAKINGKDAVFEADSGAWFSMISPTGASDYDLKLHMVPAAGFYLRGLGGAFVPSMTTVKSFTLAGATLNDVQFLVGGSEIGATGLIGQNVLAFADDEFDLGQGVIRLMRSKNCAKAALAYWAKPGQNYSVIDTERTDAMEPQITATITVNGTRLRAVFDTGAGASFVSLEAAARIGLKPNGPGVTPAGVTMGLGRSLTRTWIGPVSDVKIGDEEIRNTRLRFGGDVLGADMLIGADFFLSHHVYWSGALRKLFFTFNGGHVFDLRYMSEGEGPGTPPQTTPVALPEGPPPADAAAFARRGDARAARGDFAGGLDDLDEAVKRAPDDADLLRQRAELHARMKQYGAGIEDASRGLKLQPDNVDLLLLRAGLSLVQNPDADVRADLAAANKVISPVSDRRFRLARLYMTSNAFPEAIAEYGRWMDAHREDAKRAEALNGQCFARALMGKELDLALRACNSALSLAPRMAGILDSRGLVRLRMGDFAKAVTDYDAALAATPDMAWSHYGRGIAELRLGRKQEGEADLAKARLIDPAVSDRAVKLGITP